MSRSMQLLALAGGFALLLCPGVVGAAVLTQFDFGTDTLNPTAAATTVDPLVTATAIQFKGTALTSSGNVRFSTATGNPVNSVISMSAATADTSNGDPTSAASPTYFDFALTPTGGPVTFQSLTLDCRTSDSNAARETFFAVKVSSTSDFTASTPFAISGSEKDTTFSTFTADLSALPVQSGITYFRLYYSEKGAASSPTLGSYFDNITVTGIPEPTSLAAVLLVGLWTTARRRRA